MQVLVYDDNHSMRFFSFELMKKPDTSDYRKMISYNRESSDSFYNAFNKFLESRGLQKNQVVVICTNYFILDLCNEHSINFDDTAVIYAEKYFNNLKYYFDNNSDVLTIDNHFNVNNQEFMLEISPIKLVRIVNIETGKKFRCNERNFLDQVSSLKTVGITGLAC